MNTSEIENMLRQAPRPKAPTGLNDQLLAQATVRPLTPTLSASEGEREITMRHNRDEERLPLPLGGGEGRGERTPGSRRSPRGSSLASYGAKAWLRRWWPALAAATASAACAAIFGLQQLEIRDLKQTIEVLAASGAAQTAAVPASETPKTAPQNAPAETVEQEIARLKEQAAKLAAEISRLEQLQQQNQELRSQISAASAAVLSPEETAAMEQTREKNLSIVCVNNLKQLCLAARTWALDNSDMTPAHIIEMTNEMSTPKLLVCPADSARQPASNWSAYGPANCSYDYLAPAAPDGKEPIRVMFRCPIHGHIGLMDGSVQMNIAKNHPDWLVEHDGKLYLKDQNRP